MTSQAINLYEALRPKSIWLEIPLLATFNALLIACAYISISLPFSPVPITGQTFGVLLIAMALGRIRGTAVVAAYLAEGALGAPVFAGGSAGFVKLVGPTGGYLMGFLAASFVVGYLADKGWDKSVWKAAGAMSAGTVIIFAFGLLWLSGFLRSEMLPAAGLVPFLPGAVIKIGVASAVLPGVWRLLARSRHDLHA